MSAIPYRQFTLFKLDELFSLGRKINEEKRRFISQKLYIENKEIPENELYVLSILSLNVGNKYVLDGDY